MNREFARRLRDPDLDGIPFISRVEIVRVRLARERADRREPFVLATIFVGVLAISVSLLALGFVANGEWEHQKFVRKQEIWRLQDVMHDVEDRVYRDGMALLRLQQHIDTYQGQKRQGQSYRPSLRGPIYSQPSRMSSIAFFEAFNGRGTTTACDTVSPTGAKGEALTFTRASTAMCTKTATGGLATTGIANGDLVSLATDKARVEYDSNGVLGLLAEGTRTNSLPRSEEIDNAAWTKGAAIGTITANFATAPDGTLTADRYQYSNTNNDYVLQSFSVGGLAATITLYLKGTSGSGTIDLCRGGAGGQCVACPYVSTSWSRCTYAATLATSANVLLGCETSTKGSACNNTGFDVLVWGFDGELGAYATSYIPTTSAAVTRAAETATFPVIINTANGYSHSHSFTNEGTADFEGGMGLYQDALNRTQLYQFSTNALNADNLSTSGNRSVSNVPGTWAARTTYRIGTSCAGAGASSTVSSYLAGVLQNTSATGLTSAWTSSVLGFSINAPWNSSHDAIYTRLCADPSPLRCR